MLLCTPAPAVLLLCTPAPAVMLWCTPAVAAALEADEDVCRVPGVIAAAAEAAKRSAPAAVQKVPDAKPEDGDDEEDADMEEG